MPARRRRCELILANGDLYAHTGKPSAVNRQVESQTGSIQIESLFPNPDNLLRPGRFARVRAVTESLKNALVVPQRAVQEIQGNHQVAVVGPDDTVDIRGVKVGPRYAGLWVITDGVKPGERVVAEGLQKVRDRREGPCEAVRARTQRKAAGVAHAGVASGSRAMSRFFINRPIVAMVIAIIMTMVGVVSMVQLPIALFPNIAPPEIQLAATYVGADALTVEQSVADAHRAADERRRRDDLHVLDERQQRLDARCTSTSTSPPTPNIDQVLSHMRYSQAESQLPQDVRSVRRHHPAESTTSPLALFSVYSPNGTYDSQFLSNYAYININDPMTRVPGVGQVTIFGAGQYAHALLGAARHALQARHHGHRDPRRAATSRTP